MTPTSTDKEEDKTTLKDYKEEIYSEWLDNVKAKSFNNDEVTKPKIAKITFDDTF